jgi:hypothetical protein
MSKFKVPVAFWDARDLYISLEFFLSYLNMSTGQKRGNSIEGIFKLIC